MPIAPKMLAAFAGKKKPKDQIEEDDADEGAADELAAEEAQESPEEEAAEGDEEIDLDAIGQQVQDGEWPDKDLMNRAKDVDEEHNPPSWALDEDIWDKAKAVVEDRWDEWDEPFAVVSAVYQKMGGQIE